MTSRPAGNASSPAYKERHRAAPQDPGGGCPVERPRDYGFHWLLPRLLTFVVVAFALVHSGPARIVANATDKPAAEPRATAPKSFPGPFQGKLPANVAEMRDAILAAAHSGDVEELKTAIEWNELKPDFGSEAGSDPIAYWKRISADGQGREILAALANLLSLAPAELPFGKDAENNAIYVWPYLAERPLDKLSPAEEVDLYRLMPPATAKTMREKNKWTWWRLSIGADGTWHTFTRPD